MKAAVSVVLPVRNGEAFLHAALASVLEQDGIEWELIVVDDGSTDRSAEIVRSVADRRVRLLPGAGTGIADALNLGLAAAEAPLVARMDADDISLPGRLLAQARVLIAEPEVVAVGGTFEVIDGLGCITDVRHVAVEDISLRRVLRYYSPFCHGSVMYRRDVVVAVGGYRRECEPVEDYELWLRLSQVGKLAALPQTIYQHRSNPEGVSAGAADIQRCKTLALSCAAALPVTYPTIAETRRNGLRSGTQPAVTAATMLGAIAAIEEGAPSEFLAACVAALLVAPDRMRAARRLGRKLAGQLWWRVRSPRGARNR